MSIYQKKEKEKAMDKKKFSLGGEISIVIPWF
jgi:hypothetical protein